MGLFLPPKQCSKKVEVPVQICNSSGPQFADLAHRNNDIYLIRIPVRLVNVGSLTGIEGDRFYYSHAPNQETEVTELRHACNPSSAAGRGTACSSGC